MQDEEPSEILSSDKVVTPDEGAHQFVAHWRSTLKAATEAFGGIQWSVNSLYKVHQEYNQILRAYVGFPSPSPFKRCAALVVAYMQDRSYPLYGEFKNHKFRDSLKIYPRYSGAILVYEYVRYCLDGAVLLKNGNTETLANPILVSEHTYIDVIQAFTTIREESAAVFHTTALLLEQLAYLENDKAPYPRTI